MIDPIETSVIDGSRRAIYDVECSALLTEIDRDLHWLEAHPIVAKLAHKAHIRLHDLCTRLIDNEIAHAKATPSAAAAGLTFDELAKLSAAYEAARMRAAVYWGASFVQEEADRARRQFHEALADAYKYGRLVETVLLPTASAEPGAGEAFTYDGMRTAYRRLFPGYPRSPLEAFMQGAAWYSDNHAPQPEAEVVKGLRAERDAVLGSFNEICDDLGCARDNEAALLEISALQARAEAAEKDAAGLRAVVEEVDAVSKSGADTIAFMVELNRIAKRARAALAIDREAPGPVRDFLNVLADLPEEMSDPLAEDSERIYRDAPGSGGEPQETEAEITLRSLASYVGCGGFNADKVDPDVFYRKVVDGIDMLIAPWVEDAKRYRVLRRRGAAPGGTKHLEDGNVLVTTNLDAWIDALTKDGLGVAPAAATEYAPRPDMPAASGRETLDQACKPWEFSVGDPPAWDSPLHQVFVAGMTYAEKLLCGLLDVKRYEGGDGSEDFDADATMSLRNILKEAGMYEEEHGTFAKLATRTAPDADAARGEGFKAGIEQAAQDAERFLLLGGHTLLSLRIPKTIRARAAKPAHDAGEA